MIFVFMFSIILGIIGYGHYNLKDEDDLQVLESGLWYPNAEFEHLIFQRVSYGEEIGYEELASYVFVNFLVILRFSLGDYGDFRQVQRLNFAETLMFWLMWLVIVIMTSVIFLNFVIAEVNESYVRVQDNVQELVYKERAKLIEECEDMMPQRYKNSPHCFPKYVIYKRMEE